MVKASEFFALPASLARFAAFFSPDAAPWDWLKTIGSALESVTAEADGRRIPAGVHIEGRVWLDATVKLPPQAVILGPTYVGARTEIRPGAFIRGNVIAGEDCVLGHASEFKNCLLLDRALAPHFNYVGDSILGNGAHLGAGVICSNVRLDRREVRVRRADRQFATGLRKFGAVLGDGAEVGCNSVLNPGTLLGPRALVTPCMAFTGSLAAGAVARSQQTITISDRAP